MASIFTIAGYDGGTKGKRCKCVKGGHKLCKVAKSKKHPSGWTFVKGRCHR